ncbi:MAG TPA: hypothetical protein VE172_17270 [Stackebrandtia sp.]|uniref:hypothetical protein n=1 Tax=Stackebrandtia sp. TaxID=2023065 RepID=UPI002D4A46CD|nr:hypothetical protein [Stackebrandtia sp.]HZE40555.1 hypothetical protein [Stackebrandtia sp.]
MPSQTMKNHMFTVVLDHEPNDEEFDALFEAGCDDGGVGSEYNLPTIQFDRKAHSMSAAIASAIRDIESTGMLVLNVLSEDLFTLQDIADKVDTSREAVRRYSTGDRGPGGFPPPINPGRDGTKFYRWNQVAPWLREHIGLDAPDIDADVVVADLMLQVRNQHPSPATVRNLCEVLKF